MNENQVNQYNQYEVRESVAPKKKKNVKLIVALIVVVLVAGLFGVYKFVINSPKNVFLRAINNELKQWDGMFDSTVSTEDTVITNSTLNFDITVQEGMLTEDQLALLNEINALNLIMDTQYDPKNKQLGYNMSLNHNTSDLFSFGLYGKTNSFYVDLKNYFDKYIEIPVEDYETLFENKNTEDVEYVLTFMKDSFLNNLENKDFKETKETISIGNKDIKTNKITYVFTEESTMKLVAKMMEDMKNNDKFIEALATTLEVDEKEVKQFIEEGIDSLKEVEASDSDTSIEISVYTKGLMNESVQFAMAVNSDSKFEVKYSNYEDEKRFSMLEDNETLIDVVNVEEKENTYKTTMTMDTITLVVNSTKKDEDWNHTYKLTESESTSIISGEITSVSKEITKDKEYTNDMKFTLSFGVQDMENVITVAIESSSNSKIGESITLPDVNNSVLYTNLTEEEMNKISENILNNQNLLNFINKISAYTNTEGAYDYYESESY